MTKVKKVVKDHGLTEKQKKEVLDMFDRDPIPEETKYEYYKEIIAHDKKIKEQDKTKEA